MSPSPHDDLPLSDHDQLSAGELEHRVRALTADAVERLVRYERAHAARTPVLELLMSRLEQLEAGSQPSPGGSLPHDGPSGAGRRTSPVSPATSPEPIHPPPHGSPWQYGRPKGNRP